MRSLSSLVILTLVAAFSMGGCAWLRGGPISLPVYKLQQPDVSEDRKDGEPVQDVILLTTPNVINHRDEAQDVLDTE